MRMVLPPSGELIRTNGPAGSKARPTCKRFRLYRSGPDVSSEGRRLAGNAARTGTVRVHPLDVQARAAPEDGAGVERVEEGRAVEAAPGEHHTAELRRGEIGAVEAAV